MVSEPRLWLETVAWTSLSTLKFRAVVPTFLGFYSAAIDLNQRRSPWMSPDNNIMKQVDFGALDN